MSAEAVRLLTSIYRTLVGIGALASLWFFIDYIRAADLSSPFSKMILLLNGAISLILTISFIRHFRNVDDWVNIVTLFAFFLVDAALVFQIYLLRKSRDS